MCCIVQCIKVFCPSKIAYLGNLVLVSLLWINKKKFARLKLRLQQKFLKGSLHRGLLIRSKMYFVRSNGIRIRFDEILLYL